MLTHILHTLEPSILEHPMPYLIALTSIMLWTITLISIGLHYLWKKYRNRKKLLQTFILLLITLIAITTGILASWYALTITEILPTI